MEPGSFLNILQSGFASSCEGEEGTTWKITIRNRGGALSQIQLRKVRNGHFGEMGQGTLNLKLIRG